MAQVTVYVKDELRDRMREAAEEHDVNWSEVAAVAIEETLESLEHPEEELDMTRTWVQRISTLVHELNREVEQLRSRERKRRGTPIK